MVKRAGFSLIELLVVISIIALLIAILLPALSSANQSADRIREAANTMSLIQSCTSFAVDRKSVLPSGQQGPTSYHMRWANKPQWEILVNDYGLPYEENSGVFGCSSWAKLNPSPFYQPGNDWQAPWVYWGGFQDQPSYKFMRTLDDATTATSTTLTTCWHNKQPVGTNWKSYAPHPSSGGDIGMPHLTPEAFDANPPGVMCVGRIDASVTWEDFQDMKPFQSSGASTFWYAH
ncbi:MAG: prepilin-type N-terminal cleavage/methylation domain-containing protein [Planctomycetota bacterium]